MVIDASNLPSGTILSLQNVEFAVIIGPASIFGGDGQNTLYAGTGSQFIVLGPDDDVLHGGDGDDTVGSKGGDDLLFGDNGNDTLFGGEGNDQLHGGRDSDVVTYDGNLVDYDLQHVDGVITVSSRTDANDNDTLINVEQVQFADQVFIPAYEEDLQVISMFYQQILGRRAEVDGFQWQAQHSGLGVSLGQLAVNFLESEEFTLKTGIEFDQLTIDNQIEALYNHVLGRESDAGGKAAWLEYVDAGHTIVEVAEGFLDSEETQGLFMAATEWNFIV